MRTNVVLALLICLATAPVVHGHEPAGTPKNYCESPQEWYLHDYGPPAQGVLSHGYEDGNLGGDCDGTFNPGYLCPYADPNDPLHSSVGLCEFSPPIADWDGHDEFGVGGALVLVDSGAGVPSGDPSVGAGTLYCFGAEGHHADFGPVSVEDAALGGSATFTVGADTVDLLGTGAGCGDFETDTSTECAGACAVTFPAGLDGAYVVKVRGSQGHVRWGEVECPCPKGPLFLVPNAFMSVGYTRTAISSTAHFVPPQGWSCEERHDTLQFGATYTALTCYPPVGTTPSCEQPRVRVEIVDYGSATGRSGCGTLVAECQADADPAGNFGVGFCEAVTTTAGQTPWTCGGLSHHVPGLDEFSFQVQCAIHSNPNP